MSQFSQEIYALDSNYRQAEEIKEKIKNLSEKLGNMNQMYVRMLEAQQLLTTVSNENTTQILDYITGIINKTLGELFPHDNRRIYLEKVMFRDQHAHINIRLTGTNGKTRDLTLQSGTGLRQVISFLFVLSLIEVRKGRRILIADELLSGVHPEAKRIVMEIVQIFAEEGFQFVFVEYGVDDIGKIYLVEKPNEVATVTPLDGKYNNEIFVFNRPPEEVDLSYRVDEGADNDADI